MLVISLHALRCCVKQWNTLLGYLGEKNDTVHHCYTNKLGCVERHVCNRPAWVCSACCASCPVPTAVTAACVSGTPWITPVLQVLGASSLISLAGEKRGGEGRGGKRQKSEGMREES